MLIPLLWLVSHTSTTSRTGVLYYNYINYPTKVLRRVPGTSTLTRYNVILLVCKSVVQSGVEWNEDADKSYHWLQ